MNDALTDKAPNKTGTIRHIILLVTIASALLTVVLVTSGCGRRRQVEVDVMEPYRAAMKEVFYGDLDLVRDQPRYVINVSVDPSYEMLTGTAKINITNTSSDPWTHLVFRLYPMLQQYGGEMKVLSALAAGEATQFVYQADNTAVRVNLQEPLPPNDQVSVELSWKLTIPDWGNARTTYALFGNSQGITSLPLFYPSLAVYEPGPAIGTGHWWLDQGSVRGDAAFNVTSLFSVTAILPMNAVPVTSGSLVATDTVGEDRIEYQWITGPVREFLLHMSPNFSSMSMDAYGTTVTSYYLPGKEDAARQVLEDSVGALRYYSDYFGGYPFRELNIAPAALSYRGMEYPLVSLLGISLYDDYRDDLETLTAHEIAHQWWYQIVHNDPVRSPWLDEALAEYSMGAYFEALHGKHESEMVEYMRWQIPLDLLRENEGDSAMDLAVEDYENGSQYETIIYAKGALFYEELYDILGDREFREFLRNYLKTYRYQIVDTDDWLAMLEELGNPSVEPLFGQWITASEPVVTNSITESLTASNTVSIGEPQVVQP